MRLSLPVTALLKALFNGAKLDSSPADSRVFNFSIGPKLYANQLSAKLYKYNKSRSVPTCLAIVFLHMSHVFKVCFDWWCTSLPQSNGEKQTHVLSAHMWSAGSLYE